MLQEDFLWIAPEEYCHFLEFSKISIIAVMAFFDSSLLYIENVFKSETISVYVESFDSFIKFAANILTRL